MYHIQSHAQTLKITKLSRVIIQSKDRLENAYINVIVMRLKL